MEIGIACGDDGSEIDVDGGLVVSDPMEDAGGSGEGDKEDFGRVVSSGENDNIDIGVDMKPIKRELGSESGGFWTWMTERIKDA